MNGAGEVNYVLQEYQLMRSYAYYERRNKRTQMNVELSDVAAATSSGIRFFPASFSLVVEKKFSRRVSLKSIFIDLLPSVQNKYGIEMK